MLTYHESSWAVRRWDWLNGGKVVMPQSFCQFWRTALLYASIRWLLLPLAALGELAQRIPLPTLPRFMLAPFLLLCQGCWLAVRLGARGLWRLTYPLRCAGKAVGGATLTGLVAVGEPVVGFGERHKEGLTVLGVSLVVLVAAAEVAFIAVLLLLESWFWSLVGLGGLVVSSLALYGLYKSGVLGLLWQAAVAAHHGICPPVEIVREE